MEKEIKFSSDVHGYVKYLEIDGTDGVVVTEYSIETTDDNQVDEKSFLRGIFAVNYRILKAINKDANIWTA